ncbi:putative ribonuclease H-like domain-containing protein [Tanacetum coccineum]
MSEEAICLDTLLTAKNLENQKGKGPDWMFDLELLTPSMNYIPVRKENYADSGGNVSTHDDVDDLDDQQFIVHETSLHDELVSLMHQESLAKLHNDAQRNAFEKEKKRIALEKGKECVDSTFTLSTANTPPQSTGNTPTDSDDDIPNDGVFSTNSFDAENTDTEEGGAADYNKHDPNMMSTSIFLTLRIHKNSSQSQISAIQNNHKDKQGLDCLRVSYLKRNQGESSQALADEKLVEAMKGRTCFNSSYKRYGCYVDLPDGKRTRGGVDYDEVFAPVARIEAIRLFLAFASFMGFTVYQMDVKSAFLYANQDEGTLNNLRFWKICSSKQIYRVVKALLRPCINAPSACMKLSTFLLKHGYRRGAIDKTLFIKKDRRDIMLVQVYVDDIIFGSTKSSMVKDFEDLMQKEFKMSSMGELTFFLGLQVKQTSAGIFLETQEQICERHSTNLTLEPLSLAPPHEAHKSLEKDDEIVKSLPKGFSPACCQKDL